MILLNIFTLIAAIANILLGLVVFIKNPKKAINISFFIFSAASFVWGLANFYFFSVQKSLLIFELVYSTGALAIIFFIPWLHIFLQRNPSKYKIAIFYLVGIMFFILPLIRGAVIGDLSLLTDGELYSFTTGPLFTAFGVGLLAFIVYLNFFVIMNYRKARGVLKKQLVFIILGVVLYSIVGVVVGILLPLLNISFAVPFDSQASLFLVGFSAYAIAKHRLMDIKAVVARSLAYVLLIVTLAGFYAGVIMAAQAFVFPDANYSVGYVALQIVLAIIMAFSFQPLRKWITRATDKVFFKNQYDQDDLLTELSTMLGSTIVLIELLYKVGDILTKNIKTSRVLFALIKDDTRMYSVQAIGYKQTPDVIPKDVLNLTRDGIVHLDELEENSRRKHLLGTYEAVLAIPIKTEKEVVGVLLLGEKNSGDMYSQQDISVLEILAPELAVAIENAKSYEEISRFNVTLRQEIKHATHRLKQKNEELLALDKAKDEFISMASHQLRTPLTAIKGYLSMLLEGDAGEIKVSQYDFINEAYSGANRMVGLINDLLNVSRMDTGRFFIEHKDLDVERVVNEEVHQLLNNAKARGLKLEVVKKGKIPHIWADETKIRQVVMNFIDNALYYTSQGGVTVYLKHDKTDLIFEVHDTGMGVPPEQQKHLFEKFYRADNARTVRPDGTGLGIYLAKRVIEDHGGVITFSSVIGKGSVFGFRFPLKKIEKAKA